MRPYLQVIVDQEDRGLLRVNQDWVAYIAEVKDDSCKQVVESWFEAMQQEYPKEEIYLDQEAPIVAIRDLVTLCKYAVRRELEVYHYWCS